MNHGRLQFEYNRITPYIYIGTNMCCKVHFKRSLLRKGISADISMEAERVDNPFGVDYFLWLPTTDHRLPTMKQLYTGAQFLQMMQNQKVKTYVHCQRGHGRAPAIVAAYLITTGMTVDEAIAFIKKKRKSIHVDKKQILGLKKFSKRWKK
jgi:hypothetical protein